MSENVRTYPNVLKCIRTHSNTSERIHTHPKASNSTQMYPNVSNHLRETEHPQASEHWKKLTKKLKSLLQATVRAMYKKFTQKKLRLSCKHFETPLLKELSPSSQDSFESEFDSKESREDWLNSPKSGKNEKWHFWRNYAERPEILSNRISIRKNPGIFDLIPSKVAFCVFSMKKLRDSGRA